MTYDFSKFRMMLDQALSFYCCAELCRKGTDKTGENALIYATPELVNYAFSCELYLKALLYICTGEMKKGHKLDELFYLLPNAEREVINENVKKIYDRDRDALGFSLLERNADIFEKWRYSYELKGTHNADISYLQTLARVLDDRCRSKYQIVGDRV